VKVGLGSASWDDDGCDAGGGGGDSFFDGML
jgi:hypothetical protein